MKGKILFVDDEETKRTALRLEADRRDYAADEAADALEGLEKLQRSVYDVVVTDLRMPRMSGLDLLKEIRRSSPDTTVLIMTAYGSVDGAVEAVKAGAADYLQKPFSAEQLFGKLDRLLAYREALALTRTEGHERVRSSFHGLVGVSAVMQEVYRTIDRVAATPTTVLVSGESGTGKELVADAIQALSDRPEGPYVKVSCASLARDVLESELFGHVQGAFTGAVRDHRGHFEVAHGGTILLDDLDDVPGTVQAKLLRVLQNREIQRVGGERPIPVDVRLIATTKVVLEDLVRQGRFREDLAFRLKVFHIHLLPLRERREDIPILAHHFRQRFAERSRREVRHIEEEAMAALLAYSWPGNVRELENALERAVTLAWGDGITLADLPEACLESETEATVSLHLDDQSTVDLVATMRTVEESLLRWALERAGGNQVHAAELLGIPRSTLRDHVARLGISPPRTGASGDPTRGRKSASG